MSKLYDIFMELTANLSDEEIEKLINNLKDYLEKEEEKENE